MVTDDGEVVGNGAIWYVRYPGDDPSLVRVLVTDVTEKTVMVEPHDSFRRPSRYEIGYLKFVERAS